MKQLTSVRRSPERQTVPQTTQLRTALVFILTLVVTSTAGLLVGSHRPAAVTPESLNLALAGAASRPAGWYFRTSQWQADARTLVAALEYLVMPEPA